MLQDAVRKTSCVFFGIVCLLMSQVARAADAEADSKRLYAKGIAAQQAGDQKAARAAFAAAWKLRPHFKIAGNLGAVESELGLYREAAAHLDAAIALYKKGGKNGGTNDQKKLDRVVRAKERSREENQPPKKKQKYEADKGWQWKKKSWGSSELLRALWTFRRSLGGERCTATAP